MAELAAEMTADYMNNLDALGIDAIDHFPRCTDHMDEIIGPGGAFEALEGLKAEGRIRALGLGVRNHRFLRRAIETGRQSPSTTTALRLAAALGPRVEELFTLSRAEASEPSWAWAPERGEGRFWEAVVGHRRLLYPVETTALGSLPHDGCFGPGALVRRPWAEPTRTLVVAGCDPAVGLLAAELAGRDGVRLLPLTRGSRDALELLKRGLVHAAGVHWSDESTEDANAVMAAGILGKGTRLVHVVRWQEGVAIEHSGRPRSAAAIARSRLRWIAREEGSGARHVLDKLLGEHRPRFLH